MRKRGTETVELERSTLADWVGGTSALLAPLVEALRRHVMSATKLHADDTPVPVLAPGNGKTKTGRLWTYVRDDRPAGDTTPAAVWFAYTPDRKGEHPQAHLSSFTGTLQADGYAGFDQIYEAGRIQEAACWAHVRRKFHDLMAAHKSPVAAEALERIGALYTIEKEIRGRSPEQRREVRNQQARPLLESLKQWLEGARLGKGTPRPKRGLEWIAQSQLTTMFEIVGLVRCDDSAPLSQGECRVEAVFFEPGTTPAPMRVLIADDHQVIRKSISSILQSRKDIRVCGEAANGKEAVSKAQLLKPDLLILDISLPDSSGLEVATAIKKLLPEDPILLLSAYAGKQLSEKVKRRGFQGFISKNDAATTLIGAVDAIVHLKQSFYPAC